MLLQSLSPRLHGRPCNVSAVIDDKLTRSTLHAMSKSDAAPEALRKDLSPLVEPLVAVDHGFCWGGSAAIDVSVYICPFAGSKRRAPVEVLKDISKHRNRSLEPRVCRISFGVVCLNWSQRAGAYDATRLLRCYAVARSEQSIASLASEFLVCYYRNLLISQIKFRPS